MPFAISKPLDAAVQSIQSTLQPITTVYLDPAYTGNQPNIFNNWNDAHAAASRFGGTKTIELAYNADSQSYFQGASGNYDMTNTYLTSYSKYNFRIKPTTPFTLLNPSGIIAVDSVITLDSSALSQDFILINADDANNFTIRLTNFSSPYTPPVDKYIIRGVKQTVFDTLTVNIDGEYHIQYPLASRPWLFGENGLNLKVAFYAYSALTHPTNFITDGGNLLITQSSEAAPSICQLAAGYTNIGGAVTINKPPSPFVRVINRDPGVNDDGDGGGSYSYKIGDMWVNTNDGGVFICTNNTDGAAVWKEITFVP